MAYYESISIEELPSISSLPQNPLLPTSIDEEDDLRSLLYIFDDSNVERVAALYLLAQAEAQAAAEMEQQRTEELVKHLETLLDEDEAFTDLIGRRLLAINGYDVPDIWSSSSSHFWHAPQLSDMHDEWDLDWLGRELLSGREGADVWIIEHDCSPVEHIVSIQGVPLLLHTDEDEEPDTQPSQAAAQEHLLDSGNALVAGKVDSDTHRPRKTIKVADLRNS